MTVKLQGARQLHLSVIVNRICEHARCIVTAFYFAFRAAM